MRSSARILSAGIPPLMLVVVAASLLVTLVSSGGHGLGRLLMKVMGG
ncbi:MAG TPA: hypothetical protein VIK22_04050 [Candidatus Anoxymicrobiaceae bacterium]